MDSIENIKTISSPIRWAGSKKTLIKNLFTYIPVDKKIYVEPFLGSGTVLINILYNQDKYKFTDYYVNDKNNCIIMFFKKLKFNRNDLIDLICKEVNKYNNLSLEEKEKYYYRKREEFNNRNSKDQLLNSANFYILMKTCFNGVFRVNGDNKYNVPFGRKEYIANPTEQLINISKLIRNVHFCNMDYKSFLEKVFKECHSKQIFIYCDPPYIPDENAVYKKQNMYSKYEFNHEEFCSCISEYSKRANICISMSDSPKSNKIYGGLFEKTIVRQVSRIVNPSKKMQSLEVIFNNYL